MLRFLAPTLLVAVAVVACDKKAAAPGGGGAAPSAPVSANQTGPSNPGPIDPATVGSIKGVVKLDGWLKPDVPVQDVLGVAYCGAHWKQKPPMGDKLVMGEGQTMANVLVYVTKGLGNRPFDVPKQPGVFDQVGCVYTPHVQVIRAGQPLLVRNSDSLLHNVHGRPQFNAEFNKGQNNKGAEDMFHFPNPETAINVKCDVHPWMSAWLHVIAHPFFKLTGIDGAYALEGLPEGEYEIEAWHERIPKPLVAKVKVKAKETATLDFTFKGGEKPVK